MPHLTELTIAQRKNTILEITRRKQLNPSESIASLCETMGITERIYYYWIHEDPEMIETFRQMINDSSREELAAILSTWPIVLQRIIVDALGAFTSPAERLKILKYLDDHAEKLADKHRATGDDSAREFLNGPTQVSATSRFSSQTVNIMPQDDGSVDVRIAKETEVIEAALRDIKEAQANQKENQPNSLPCKLSDIDLNSLIAEKSLTSKGPSRKLEQ